MDTLSQPFEPGKHSANTEQRGDMAFHDAFARFGGRRGCVEGVRLYARMSGLPLTPLVVRTLPSPLSQAAGNEPRPNQDRVSHALVKSAQRVILPRDAFLRNATERRHDAPVRRHVRGYPPLRGWLRLDRRDDPLTWPPTSARLPFFIRPRSPHTRPNTFRCPSPWFFREPRCASR